MDNGQLTIAVAASPLHFLVTCKVIAKPQKGRSKSMGQDVHVGRKISYIAAKAASTIVNCPLSIVNFLGFATGSTRNS
jgi:hypothetical protein